MKREVFWKNAGYKVGKPIKGIHKARFLIVGGGISGLSFAHFLLEEKVPATDIILVEGGIVGEGSTGRSAGMLVPEMETEENVGWETLIQRYGLKLAKAYRHAHLDALQTIKHIIKKEKISCGAYEGDFLTLARTADAKGRVEDDIRARRMMGERPTALKGIHLMNEFGSPGFIFAERAHKGLSVNPLAMAQGIGTYLRKRGVAVYEHSPLLSTYGNTARFESGAVDFKKIIYARGVGENDKQLHKYATTIAVTEKLTDRKLDILKLADLDLFIDEEGVRSFHYGKITSDGHLLLGYGDVRMKTESAVTDLHEPHLRNIQKFLERMFPHVELSIQYAWSGIYAISQDLLPIVSFKKDSVTINGAGIQLGSVAAAHYAAHMLLKGRHPLSKLWHPDGV